MDDDVQSFLRAGADTVLAKPMMTDQLKQIIAYVEHHGNDSVMDQGIRLSFSNNGWKSFEFL